MNKKKVFTITKYILFWLVFLLILMILSNVLRRKDSYKKYAEFFEEQQEFDVLFFGTSHVINGIYPMELWEDYGITSYNMAGHGCAVPASYWMLKNSLDYHKPKVVVIDCWACNVNCKGSVGNNDEQMHNSFDAFPLTKNKFDAIMDISEDGFEPIDFFFDFSVYHNRWNEITKEDVFPTPSCEKGAESRIAVVPSSVELLDKSDADYDETVAKEYLRKMIDLCKEQDIQVVLTYLPFPAVEDEIRSANSIEKIAQEKNVPYINFLYEDICDLTTDCYDSNSHLNPSGARKITNYMGNYLTSNCNLQSHKDEADYESWTEDYKKYNDFKIENLRNEENIYSFLMLLYDAHFRVEVKVREESPYLQDGMFVQLLGNIGLMPEDVVDSNLPEDTNMQVKIYEKNENILILEKKY